MKQNVQFPFQNRTAAEDGAEEDDARSLRVLMVLSSLARAQHPQTLSQLSQRLHVPKATLMRLLAAMERTGFVVRMPAERGYVPGPGRRGAVAADPQEPADAARVPRILARLVASLGETCNLTALDGDRVLYVERVETHEHCACSCRPASTCRCTAPPAASCSCQR